MRRLIIVPYLFLLSGCPGGIPAPQPGSTFINGEHLCFSIDRKDVLNYYRIESNQGKGYHVVKYADNLRLSYPDDCIDMKWEVGSSYSISYGLNGKNYVQNVFIDNNGQVKDTEY